MTRRDYEIIAEAIAATGGDYATREEAAVQLSVRLKAQNPRFDQGIFMTACGFNN